MICTHVANACGTIGILHSVAAASDLTGGPIALTPDSWFDKFIRSTLSKSPDERAAELEVDDGAAECHDEIVAQVRSSSVIQFPNPISLSLSLALSL